MITEISFYEQLVIFFFIILISLVVNFTDLYSIFRNRNKWIPVNFPPYLNGDEYHSFTLQNEWVVGYGMDNDKGFCRNYNSIFEL